jgi:PST family polysaccharide transporter
LTVYFLPKLAVAKIIRKRKLFWVYKGIPVFFYFGVTIVYFTRFFIVKLLLRRNFYQWPLCSLAISRRCIKSSLIDFRLSVFAKNLTAFIVTEFISFDHLLLSIFLVSIYGLEGCNGACLDVFRILYCLVFILGKVYFSFQTKLLCTVQKSWHNHALFSINALARLPIAIISLGFSIKRIIH